MKKCALAGLVVLAAMTAGGAAERQPAPDDPVFVALYDQGSAFLKGKDVPAQPRFREHLDHLRSRSEWLIAGGPFTLRSDDQAVGLVVFQAIDAADAQRWISEDPAVVEGVFRATVRQWRVTNVKSFKLAESR